MGKLVLLILCSAFTHLVCFAQTSNEVQTNRTEYSESKPYIPTEFANENSRKEKKTKNKKSNVVETNSDKSVIVPVTVFGGEGKLITDLNKSDFRLFADEKEITEFSLNKFDEALNIVLLVDTSPSAEFAISDYQNYAAKLVDQLEPRDKVLVADFSETLNIRSDFTGDKKVAQSAIRKLKFGNGTSLYDSLEKILRDKVSGQPGRTAIILITDGVDTTSTKSNFSKSLKTAERYNVPIFVTYLDSYDNYIKNSKKSGAIVMSSPPFLGYPPTSQKNSVALANSVKSEFDTGKHYLNELIRLSGGRASLLKNMPESQDKILPDYIPEMRLKYYLKFQPAEGDRPDERKQIKVRVDRPNLFILAKGSYITN